MRGFLHRSVNLDGGIIGALLDDRVSKLSYLRLFTVEDLTCNHPVRSIIYPKVIPMLEARYLVEVAIPSMLKDLPPDYMYMYAQGSKGSWG